MPEEPKVINTSKTGIYETGYKGANCGLCDTTYLWDGSEFGSGNVLLEMPVDCEFIRN